jgi:hypothetical protein
VFSLLRYFFSCANSHHLLGLRFHKMETVEMRINLGQIADIRTGYTLREGLSKSSPGDKFLVQMSDFESLNQGVVDKVKTTNMKVRSPDWMLQERDLLVKARGTDFTPVVVQKAFHGAVFTHPLVRIRVNGEFAVPEFIAWLLSRPNIQAQLQRLTAGTLLQMLKLDILKGLELYLPSLDRQQKVQELVQLMKQEQMLLGHLMTKRKQLVNCSIENLLLEEPVNSAKIIEI